MKRIQHQNTYGDISSLPLCALLKGADVFRNTKGTDMQACVHAEIDKSFIAQRSWQKLCLCCQITTFFLLHLFKNSLFPCPQRTGK